VVDIVGQIVQNDLPHAYLCGSDHGLSRSLVLTVLNDLNGVCTGWHAVDLKRTVGSRIHVERAAGNVDEKSGVIGSRTGELPDDAPWRSAWARGPCRACGPHGSGRSWRPLSAAVSLHALHALIAFVAFVAPRSNRPER